jgi:hypothetical protein
MDKSQLIKELEAHGVNINNNSKITIDELKDILAALKAKGQAQVIDGDFFKKKVTSIIKNKMISDMGGCLTDLSLNQVADEILKLI